MDTCMTLTRIQKALLVDAMSKLASAAYVRGRLESDLVNASAIAVNAEFWEETAEHYLDTAIKAITWLEDNHETGGQPNA